MNEALNIVQLEIGYPQKRGMPIKVAGPIDLSISSGELICLLGPNGVGKTTLLRTLAAIQPSISGETFIYNKKVSSVKKKNLAHLLSVVLTDRIIHGNLTAYDLISIGRAPHTGWFGNLNSGDKEKIGWAISNTNTKQLITKSIHQLSDGERQKVMIARALAQDTPVMLLDEPTAHLDIPNRIDIIRLLKKLAKDTEKAIILSTHELDLALQAADKIWLMSLQNKTYFGTPEDLVLNDVFGNVFIKDGIEFDKGHGVFKVVKSEGKEISIGGNSVGVFWTKRALEREGYLVSVGDRSNAIVQISFDKTWGWRFQDEALIRNFNTIQELIESLKRKGVVS